MKKIILGLLLLVAVNVHSATYYFIGSQGGSLATAGNWTTNPSTFTASTVAPTSVDDVVFNVGTANNTTNTPLYVSLASANRIYNSVTMVNAGAMTFYRSSTFTNASNTLEIGSGGFTVASGAGPVTIGTVTSSTNFGGVTLRSAVNTSINNNSTNALTLQNTLASTATSNGAVVTFTFGGTGTGGYILNSGAENKSSSNTNNVQVALVMNNANATLAINGSSGFSGGFTLNAGTVSLGNSSGLGTGLLTLNGGTVASAITSRTVANNILMGGDVTLGGLGYQTTFTGNVDLNGGTRNILLGNSAIFSGNISNGGLVVGSSSATRTFTLNGTNTYTGPTVVTNVGLVVNGSLLSSVTAGTNSTVNVNGSIAGSTVSGGTLIVTGAGGNTVVNTGTATVNSGGTITTATVNGGLLSVNGTAGNVLVNSGGTLGGSGTLGTITLNGGSLAPGNSPGLLTAANLDASNGSLRFELGAPTTRGVTYDAIDVTGLLTLGSNTTWNFTIVNSYSFQLNDAYDLFNWGTLDVSTFDKNALLNALPNLDTANTNLAWSVDSFGIDGTVSVIPEPTAADLILMPFKIAKAAITLHAELTTELGAPYNQYE